MCWTLSQAMHTKSFMQIKIQISDPWPKRNTVYSGWRLVRDRGVTFLFGNRPTARFREIVEWRSKQWILFLRQRKSKHCGWADRAAESISYSREQNRLDISLLLLSYNEHVLNLRRTGPLITIRRLIFKFLLSSRFVYCAVACFATVGARPC